MTDEIKANPDGSPKDIESFLGRIASVICGAACGSYPDCKSREAAQALLDAGFLVPFQTEVLQMQKALEAVRENLVRLAWEENSLMIETIDAALSQRRDGIKPLPWKVDDTVERYGVIVSIARIAFGTYQIVKGSQGRYDVFYNGYQISSSYDTIQGAKDSAQADYVTRIYRLNTREDA